MSCTSVARTALCITQKARQQGEEGENAHWSVGDEVGLGHLKLEERGRLRAVRQGAIDGPRACQCIAVREVDVDVKRAWHVHRHAVQERVHECPHVEGAPFPRWAHLQPAQPRVMCHSVELPRPPDMSARCAPEPLAKSHA